MLRGAAASASSTSAAGMRTREPSTLAPAAASRASAASCCTSTPVPSSSSERRAVDRVAAFVVQGAGVESVLWHRCPPVTRMAAAADVTARATSTFHQEWTEVK